MKKYILTILVLLIIPLYAYSQYVGSPFGGSGVGGGAAAEDDVYGAGWNGDTTNPPSQNAVYDKIELLDTAKQDADADLDAWALITPAANMGTFLGTPTIANLMTALTDEGAFADDLLGYADASAVLTGLGIDTAANLETSLSLGAFASDLLGYANAGAVLTGIGAASSATLGTSIGNGLRLDGTVLKADRPFRTLPFDNAAAQELFTEAEMLVYSAIDNQGAGEETDIILAAVSYPISFEVETSEAFQIELCPPAGELFNHDTTLLHANDCILSSATVGSSFRVKRRQIADASWIYHTYTIQGANTDGGAGD